MESVIWNLESTMRRRLKYYFIITLLLMLGAQVPGSSLADNAVDDWEVIDRVVAVLDGIPVLLSDVLMERELGLLEAPGAGNGLGKLLQPYLNRLMIANEVEEVGSFRLSPGQFKGAFSGFLAGFESRDDFERKLQHWGIDEGEFRRRLARALTVSLYTESRIQYFVRVLPSDVERAYAESPERWGERLIYEAWDDIRESLIEEAFVREMDKWLGTLRTRYHLEIIEEINGA